MVNTVTDEDFDETVLNAKQPVVVDFWAEWCGPCKALAPVLDEAANEVSEVQVFKMNIDENPETPTKFRVRSIPTLILFKDGQPVDIKVGGLPKHELVDWLKSA